MLFNSWQLSKVHHIKAVSKTICLSEGGREGVGARGAALQTCLAQQSQTKKKRGCVVMGFIIPRTHGWCGELRWPTFFFTSKTNYKRTLPKAWQKKIKEGTKERCTKKNRPMKFSVNHLYYFFL
jgi:hypothetical protein